MSESSRKEPEIMEKLVSLCKRRGFVFQSSEIYGGLKSCYDYGPLGAELKRNVKAEWWRQMVHQREDVVGLDASIIMHPNVWKASGHLAGFSDPVVDCKLSKERFRADKARSLPEGEQMLEIEAPDKELAKVWEDALPKIHETGRYFKREGRTLKARVRVTYTLPQARRAQMQVQDPATGEWSTSFACYTYCSPNCGSPYLSDERQFNLMFRASLGPVDPIQNIQAAIQKAAPETLQDPEKLRALLAEAIEKTAVYLRPETAQAMFVNFLNVQQSCRMKPPFGIAQQGKSFRNEVTVEHFTFRSCEFEQMEMEFFVPPPGFTAEGEWDDMQWFEYWCQARLNWYIDLGIDPEHLQLREHARDELAHYAKACKDVEYLYPWGWGELEGIAHRTDYDLKAHEKDSGKKLSYFDPQSNKRYHPYVIEPAAGADRATLAFLIDAYTEEPPSEARKEGRVLLKLDPRLAPIKAAILPLVKKEGMPELAREIVGQFHAQGVNAFYDEKDAIGRRYARQDEVGTPFCITVDGETMQDRTVTLRERDSMEQERIPLEEAVQRVRERLKTASEV